MGVTGVSRRTGTLAGAVIVAAAVVLAPPERHGVPLDTSAVRLAAFVASPPGAEAVIAVAPTCADRGGRRGELGTTPTLLSEDVADVSAAVRAVTPDAADRTVDVGAPASTLAAPLSAAGAIYDVLFIPARLWMSLTAPIGQLLPPTAQQFWYILVVIVPVVVAMLPVAVVLSAFTGALAPLPLAGAFATVVDEPDPIAEPSTDEVVGVAENTDDAIVANTQWSQADPPLEAAAPVDSDPVPAPAALDPEPVSAPVVAPEPPEATASEGRREPRLEPAPDGEPAATDESGDAEEPRSSGVDDESDPEPGREHRDEPSTPPSGRDAAATADGPAADRDTADDDSESE